MLALIAISSLDYIQKIKYPLKFKEEVFKYSKEHNVDPYLIYAIIKAESNFNPDATSRKNAKGLMQITDKTGLWGAERLGLEGFVEDELYNPDTNIRIGCWYVRQLMKEFDNNMDLVIAAYNGGSGNVSEWLKNKELSRTGKTLEKIPFKETDNYLKKVKKYHSIYRRLYVKKENNQ